MSFPRIGNNAALLQELGALSHDLGAALGGGPTGSSSPMNLFGGDSFQSPGGISGMPMLQPPSSGAGSDLQLLGDVFKLLGEILQLVPGLMNGGANNLGASPSPGSMPGGSSLPDGTSGLDNPSTSVDPTGTPNQNAMSLADRIKTMNMTQHHSGDCSQTVAANMYHLATGKNLSEEQSIQMSYAFGGSPTTGMNPSGRQQLLQAMGLKDVQTQSNANVNDVAKALQQGRVVNIAVNADTLRARSTSGGPNGPLGHVINVVGVHTDASGHMSFDIVDTGMGDGVKNVSADVLANAMGNSTVMQSVGVQ